MDKVIGNSIFMTRALELARSSLGKVSPNPSVGAVLVKDGRIVGEGATQPPGGPHAEVMAINSAGDLAAGSTLYVSLEPCAHYGKTPPCMEALIAAGIHSAFVATIDPDPRTNGKGIEFLKSEGIDVKIGEGSEEAEEIIESFTKFTMTQQPFFSAKFAMSLDGKIATRTGSSKWITSEESRKRGHVIRSQSDVIMIGVGTAIADNPLLTARTSKNLDSKQPLRLIVDTFGRLPTNSRLLKQAGRTIVASSEINSSTKRSLQNQGADVFEFPRVNEGVDLYAVANFLAAEGFTSVLAEGGSSLLGSLFNCKMVDKVYAFIAPLVIGGSGAKSPVGGLGPKDLSEATTMTKLKYETIGNDFLVTGYIKK